MNSLFDTVYGLPIHALVVHFAVVILPLAAAAVAVSVYIPRFRAKFAFTSIIGTFIGLGAALVAKLSGEQLSNRVGLPKNHANYGNQLPIVASIFFAFSLLWYFSIRNASSNQPNAIGHLSALLAVAVLGLTFITGHSGAEAVWKGRLDTISKTTTSNSGSKSNTTNDAAAISMAQISKHANSSSCWSAIDGEVYDLTKWINQHPGGASVIKAICGKDGSGPFNGQHQGQGRPASELARFKIGVLK
jgi:uncharacterized membrane protein